MVNGFASKVPYSEFQRENLFTHLFVTICTSSFFFLSRVETTSAAAVAAAAATTTVSTLGRDLPELAATEATTPTRPTSTGGETKTKERKVREVPTSQSTICTVYAFSIEDNRGPAEAIRT